MTEDKEKDLEDDMKEYLDTFMKWFGGGGFSRHVGMTLLILGMSGPFIIGVIAILIVWVWVAPAASAFTERLATFGILFGLLTAIAVQIAGFSQRMVFGLFLMRRRRRANQKTAEGEYISKLP